MKTETTEVAEKPEKEKARPGLNTSAAIEPEEVDRMFAERIGPFAPDLRVACPLKEFSRRRSEKCMDCPHFVGIGTRIVIGEIDDNNPTDAMRKYMIWCDHPLARSLHHYPED